jgi:hypothetical protein
LRIVAFQSAWWLCDFVVGELAVFVQGKELCVPIGAVNRRFNDPGHKQSQPLGSGVDLGDHALVLHWIFDDAAFADFAFTHFKLRLE